MNAPKKKATPKRDKVEDQRTNNTIPPAIQTVLDDLEERLSLVEHQVGTIARNVMSGMTDVDNNVPKVMTQLRTSIRMLQDIANMDAED